MTMCGWVGREEEEGRGIFNYFLSFSLTLASFTIALINLPL